MTSCKRLFPWLHTADPAAHVFPDRRLWLYADRDPFWANDGWWSMHDYHAFSTADLETWVDHGCVLRRSDIGWASGPAWDGDCIAAHGRYWYFFPMVDQIGVAVADHPRGPFRDARGTPLITRSTPGVGASGSGLLVSPVCVRAPEGVFLYFGQNEELYCVQLAPSLVELAGPVCALAHPWRYHESPWVFYRDGRYHMVYGRRVIEAARIEDERDMLAYADSPGPYGPFEYRKDLQSDLARTVQACVVEWRDEDLLFYHEDGPDPLHRHIRAERLSRPADGAIVAAPRGSSPLTAVRVCLDPLGRHLGTDFHSSHGDVSRLPEPGGVGEGFVRLAGAGAGVRFDRWQTVDPVSGFCINLRCESPGISVLELRLMGGTVVTRLTAPEVCTEWQESVACLNQTLSGEWDLELILVAGGPLHLDHMRFTE